MTNCYLAEKSMATLLAGPVEPVCTTSILKYPVMYLLDANGSHQCPNNWSDQLAAWWHAQVCDLHMCWANNYKNTNLVGPLLICQLLFGGSTSPTFFVRHTLMCMVQSVCQISICVSLFADWFTKSLDLLMNSPTVLTLASYICRLTDISVSIVLIH